MKLYVVGYWIDYEGPQEEFFFLHEENAEEKYQEIKKKRIASYEHPYKYEAETED